MCVSRIGPRCCAGTASGAAALLVSPAVSGGGAVVEEDDAHVASGEGATIRHSLVKVV